MAVAIRRWERWTNHPYIGAAVATVDGRVLYIPNEGLFWTDAGAVIRPHIAPMRECHGVIGLPAIPISGGALNATGKRSTLRLSVLKKTDGGGHLCLVTNNA